MPPRPRRSSSIAPLNPRRQLASSGSTAFSSLPRPRSTPAPTPARIHGSPWAAGTQQLSTLTTPLQTRSSARWTSALSTPPRSPMPHSPPSITSSPAAQRQATPWVKIPAQRLPRRPKGDPWWSGAHAPDSCLAPSPARRLTRRTPPTPNFLQFPISRAPQHFQYLFQQALTDVCQ